MAFRELSRCSQFCNQHPSQSDINFQGSKFHTALQEAAWWGQDKTVAFILDHGADIDARAKDSSTALQLASSNNHAVVVEILVKRDAAVDAPAGDFGTALQEACRRESRNPSKFCRRIWPVRFFRLTITGLPCKQRLDGAITRYSDFCLTEARTSTLEAHVLVQPWRPPSIGDRMKLPSY